MKHIAIIDFGSQYTHLISRTIRELQVLAKIYTPNIPIKDYKDDCIGVILSGGPQSVYSNKSPNLNAGIFDLEVPILGICFGHQLLSQQLGGSVRKGNSKEYGKAHLQLLDNNHLLKNIPNNSQVWMSHGDSVTNLPKGFKQIALTQDCNIAAMENIEKNYYGLQFHPEVHHTAEGKQILKNFVLDICQAQKEWSIENIIDNLISKIKKQVKNKKVFLLVSGGVDSSVAFALLTRALGKNRVYGLFIDTGFMRLNESNEIKKMMQEAGFNNLHIKDAHDSFYSSLKKIVDPEQKRHIIGKIFLDVKDEAMEELGLNSEEWMLGQGTIYPDTITSGGTKHSDVIKTHHNRAPAVLELMKEGNLIEPLVDFYKDEVRVIGKLLNLPDELIKRHPFPGPGLAIRILCNSSKSNDTESVKQINGNILNRNITHRIIPIKSVGVQGDNRTYKHPIAIWGENNWEKLDTISRTITNTEQSVNRVLLLLNPSKSSQEIFLLPSKNAELNPERIKLLQDIDNIVMKEVISAKLYNDIWQFPVVLVPVGNKYYESIILRPFDSRDVMTANFYHMPKQILKSITKKILNTNKVDYVFYDITNKPPGTIEWE